MSATPAIDTGPAPAEGANAPGLAQQVKGAVIWRSGSQIASQLIAWAATFLVIRMLEPSDYGLVAMTGVVLIFLDLFNGWGFASALVRDERIDKHRIGQVFGMLILLNLCLGGLQFAVAPIAADYFHQPMVADLLRVQALFFLANPFTALANALLIRRMDFKAQSQVNLVAAVLSALTALSCAYAGLGVWTLVAAPAMLWFARAIGLSIKAKLWIRPVFRFAGAGAMARYGGAMILVQFFWFVQSQADVFVGGRMLDAHRLGIYTTALFLTQILAAKFVPPLNEVAFAAYARMQSQDGMMRDAFLKTVRLIMLIALPFYVGLAVTAEPLVLTVLGGKWGEVAPLVPILACAMPLMTLQILFAPATNALGRPALAVRTGLIGAILMGGGFAIGIQWDAAGLAWAWVGGMAALLIATIFLSLPAIGATRSALAAAVAPGLGASLAMGALVLGLDSLLPSMGVAARLALLVPFGGAAYAALLIAFARPAVEEMLRLIKPAPATA